MIKTVTTESGYTVSVDEEKLDDMRFVDALAELQDNGLALPRVMDMVFTEEDKQRLYDHVRTDDGRVPIEKTTSELCEVVRALEKNS